MSEIFGESEYLQTVGDRPFDRPTDRRLGSSDPSLSIAPVLQLSSAEALFNRDLIQPGQVFLLLDNPGQQATIDSEGNIILVGEETQQTQEEGWNAELEVIGGEADQNFLSDQQRLAEAAQETAEFVEAHIGDIFTAPDGKSYQLLEDGTTIEVFL